METLNASKVDYWNFLFTELADPRTNDWFLIKSPLPLLSLLVVYLYFVLSWGPRYMKDRKPFKLERTLIVYNFIQVVLSVWMFYDTAMIWKDYNWRCQPVNISRTPQAYREAYSVYLYFIAKISELLDTVFFVFRKNERQITLLHVYHHTVMPMISWGVTKYFPGGHGIFVGTINSFVHIIMYAYYFLSAFGPHMQKYLWWKKYITNVQMIQFCLVFVHQTQLLYTECNYPRWAVCFTMPNAVFFFFLFRDFYIKSYKKKAAAAAAQKDAADQAAAALNNDNNSCSEKDLNVPVTPAVPLQVKKSL